MENAVTPFRAQRYEADALTAEIVDPRIADVEAVARWLDYAFALPGGFRFGVAGMVGLIPGFGDALDALISLYIVIRAIQLGVPRVTVARMLVNVGIERSPGPFRLSVTCSMWFSRRIAAIISYSRTTSHGLGVRAFRTGCS